MTASATRFVTPLTFQALTHQPVHTSLWTDTDNQESGVYAAMPHIGLADNADAILVAPASANTIARLAHGMADDLLTTLVLATKAPVLIAPAMNPTMLAHPATQANLAHLAELGYTIITPDSGHMACEHNGSGRLPPTEILIAHLYDACAKASAPQDLAGKRVLITAGPTREPLDPVRYLTNRSSGKMGYSLAGEAARRGATVILVSGPTNLPTPAGVQRLDVVTTAEMAEAVNAHAHAPTCDIIIAAAAPADFKPAAHSAQKLKKGASTLSLELTLTPDIIAAVGKSKTPKQIVIGFAAETENLVAEAGRKLTAKGLDAVVANDVTQSDAGFDVETNRVVWVTANDVEEWPLLSKQAVAARIYERIVGLVGDKAGT